jgi:catechol 2,3-dioxygenase-like lactoylglutathione lyase family enzyme
MLKFHHVALSVVDLDEAIAWYGKAFGVKATLRAEPPGFRLAMLESEDGTRLEVFERPDASRTVDSSTPITIMRHHGLTHLAFTVDDLVGEHDRLVDIGATSVWDPRPSPEEGKAMAFVQDPEGNLIELIGPLTAAIEQAYPAGHATN